MPLDNSFQKRLGRSAPMKMSAAPTVGDLQFSLDNARKQPRRPVVLVWQTGSSVRALSVTCGLDPFSEHASWILRDGEEPDAPMLWKYETSDPQVIQTLVADELSEKAPAAVIPDFLRPAPDPAQQATQNVDDEERRKMIEQLDSEDYASEVVGSVFAERYEIVGEIGRGAMGAVYKARQRIIDRYVALKVLHHYLLAKPVNKKRFEHEAKAASKLHHPNLIVIHDFGTSPLGRPFIVMDYVEGPSLQDVLLKRGTLSLQLFVEVFTQCCRALAHAHMNGIVHRDLKPSNIRLTQGPNGSIVVKILDFGIAKLKRTDEDDEAQALTRTGDVLGSPLYMSPEQCKAEPIDGRSDIYSLGCVMYQTITGVLPFLGKDAFATMYKHIYEAAPPFSTVRPDLQLPMELERIVFRCLEIKVDKRYESAELLEKDLTELKNTPVFFAALQSQSQSQSGQKAVPAFTPAFSPPPSPAPPPDAMPAVAPATHAGAQEASPSAVDLLKQSGVITDADLQRAEDVTAKMGGDLVAILASQGKFERPMLEAANKCKGLVEQKKLEPAKAVILLSYCHRARCRFDDAVNELGWQL